MFLHIHSSMPGNKDCKEASAEPEGQRYGPGCRNKCGQVCHLPQDSPVRLQKFSPLPASWPRCQPQAPRAAVQQTQIDWDKGGEAKGEQLPGT